MGSESSPQRVNRHSDCRVFSGRGPLSRGHHTLWCGLDRKWLRSALFVSVLCFHCYTNASVKHVEPDMLQFAERTGFWGWSSFLFSQNWLNSGISHGVRRTASDWTSAKQRLWTLGDSSRSPLTPSPLTGGVSGNIPWTAHAELVPEGQTASLPSGPEDLLQCCCPKTSPRCALGHYVVSPEGGQGWRTLHWTGPAMSERHLHQEV